jgi:hypothetical protein
MVKKYCVSPVGKNTRHSRDSMNTLCLERQRTRTCVCVCARASNNPSAYIGLAPPLPPPPVTKAYSLIVYILPVAYMYVLACARALKREVRRGWRRERTPDCACVYIYTSMYVCICVRKLWRHLRPSDQSASAPRVRLAHCSADVCSTKASWCNGRPGARVRIYILLLIRLATRFRTVFLNC